LIDNNNHALRMDLKANNTRSFPAPLSNSPSRFHPRAYTAPAPFPSFARDPNAMEIDATRRTTLTTPVKRGPLTDKQKAYRRDHNLCMYCGLAGHLWAACPIRHPSAPLRSAAVNFSISNTHSDYESFEYPEGAENEEAQ
jgi:hypothetical protein